MRRVIIFSIIIIYGVLSLQLFADPVTTGSLVNEMVDMLSLTYFPQPYYKTVQFSSYDHRSTKPGGEHWFANSDGFGNEPVPNFENIIKEPGSDGIGEYLICDVKGPGALVRVWTAAIRGTIALYLDGSTTPVYVGSAEEFLRRPYDAYTADTGLSGDVLDGIFYQRNSAYCPIPFAKRCRIVWSGNVRQIHFYQIQMRLYESGTDVVTFRPEDLKTYEQEIRRTARIMAKPETEWEYTSQQSPVKFDISVKPGEFSEALTFKGPGAIEKLTLSLHADDLDSALRQTILHVICDSATWGQVQSPAGDFFGAAPGINPYSSIPFSVSPDGSMTSRYVMPYADNMRIVFENLGEQAVKVHGEALPADYRWDDERSMHFRARWRIDHGLVGPMGAIQDLPYLITNGAGVYVGSAVYVLNNGDGPSPGGSWWGEGDEKIFIDDDRTPSTFGTGSEDYYNYAWSHPDIFLHPYCGQPRNDGPANRGFVTNNRWHILDPLPFTYRFSFYMEYYPHIPTQDNAYARIGYHYGRPGIMDDHVVITREDVRHQKLPVDWEPAAVGGARNSVFHEAEKSIQLQYGILPVSFVYDRLWTHGRHYRWHPETRGGEIAFTIPVEEDGTYLIRMGFALDRDSGSVSMRIDGVDAELGGESGVADLYRPYRTLLRCIGTKRLELKKGESAITLRYEGDKGREDASVGIDFIWVQKL